LHDGTRLASPAGVPAPKVLAKSAVVGGVATLADLLALVVLVQVAGLPATVANVPALIAGLLVQFFGNKLFAFEDRSRDYARQGALFAAVEVGALLLNALAFHLLVTVTPLPYPAARAVGSALVYFVYSYPLWGRIFGGSK
jgi:putative flippase GtrA